MTVNANNKLADRRPNDGWQVADPYPMGRGTKIAFRCLVRAMCPPEEVTGFEDRIEVQVRVMMAYMPRLAAVGLICIVHILDWSPRWRFRGIRRLRSWDDATAAKLLDKLGHSKNPILRTLIFGIRGAILSTFYDFTEIQKRFNYDPIPFINERIQLRTRLLAGAEPSPEDALPTSPA